MATEEAVKTDAAANPTPEVDSDAAKKIADLSIAETAPAASEAPVAAPKDDAAAPPQEVKSEDSKQDAIEPAPAAAEQPLKEDAPKEPAAQDETPKEAAPSSEGEATTAAAAAAAEPAKEATAAEQNKEPTAAATDATAAAPAPAATTTTATAPSKTPIAELWELAQAHGHPEIWGVTLADPTTHIPTRIVLQKYLNANDGDLAKAKDQLKKTLEWRAQTRPLELVKKKFNKAKFGGLGYVTSYTEEGGENAAGGPKKDVFTWNIYGGVKSIEETFGNLNEFIEWRVALMELALAELSIATATEPITADHDPYKIYQVHDYKSISFLRQSPQVRAASTETIKLFAQNYPELLKEKFFVNVPAFMGFVYAFMKLFVAPKTIRKFHPMTNGANLAREFASPGSTSAVPNLGEKLPAEYGGKAGALASVGSEPLLE
ncbi:hypothetical protein VTK73DRAFT_2363 [Phialemonium thermophilum]|uniref:Phosphatidylinositol transfer protein SFH5 n=1 Tax=Phialemonium thermophilum TaxID=223376 RepID=A0ABR3X4Q7_9PEZI